MSFLGGRLAGRESADFVEESRQAISRYLEKKPSKTPPQSTTTSPPSSTRDDSPAADVLPEVLRHSSAEALAPAASLRLLSPPPPPVSTSTKWSIHSPSEESRVYGVSPDVLNPLRGYLTLPQVTFGPKRWKLPEAGSSGTASMANELRHDQHPPLDPEKIKAAGEGLAHVGKAFAGATAIVFGRAALTFGLAASTLEVHNGADIRVKGRDFVQPKVESSKDRLNPLRNWVDEASKKWHLETEHYLKEKPLIEELSKRFRAEQKAKSNVKRNFA